MSYTVKDQFGIYQARDLDHAVDLVKADDRPSTLLFNGKPVEVYCVRGTWDGMLIRLMNFTDEESANQAYEETEKYYLNLPNSEDQEGVSLMLFRLGDGEALREVTFA